MSGAITRGVLFVHSAPRALCPHVEWAAGGVLGVRVALDWIPQPVTPGLFRTELSWQAASGTGARLTSALRGWTHLRYEVAEEPSPGVDGGRWSHTPELGIFHAVTDVHGNVVVPEDRVRAALADGGDDAARIRDEIDLALGRAWDDELEPFRYAGDGAPVRWLHRVG
jgi:Protein of unknown function (DUF3145)